MLTSYFPVALITASSQTIGWDYAWPYGPDHSCRCQEVPALGDFYESNETCLEAYSKDKYQWCYYEGQGVDDSQCDSAVSIAEGVINEDCGEKCTGVVAGSVSLNAFEESCKFNFYADFGCEVAVGWQSCYSNYVYGWSDYNPQNPIQAAPIKVLHSVEGPTACQSLCQAVDQCVYWTWRAYSDPDTMDGTFQNPPLTCLLYDQEYIDGVLNTVVPTSELFASPTPYCNTDAIPECLIDPFGQEYINFFEPYSCLLCGCVSKCAWKSPYHLSGPAFCKPEYRDECSYKRPTWTSTLPPCESGDVTSTTTLSLEETSTTTGIEIDETSTEPANVPSTIGTSTTTTTTIPGTPSTDDTDMEDSTLDSVITPVGSVESAGSDAVVTPVGSVESAQTDAQVTPDLSAGTDAEVTPVGSLETAQTDAQVTPDLSSGTDAEVTPVGSLETAQTDAQATPDLSAGTDAEVTPVGSLETAQTDAQATPDLSAGTDAEVTPVGSLETAQTDAQATPDLSAGTDAEVTPVGSLETSAFETGSIASEGIKSDETFTTEMMVNPSMTMGTSTPASATMETMTTAMAPETMGTATTVPGGAPCPECDICEDDDCEEADMMLDFEEPCEDCLGE